MNSEYGQSSSKENSIEQRKPMEELKRMNQPSSAPPSAPLPQPIQPIVIQCDLPQVMSKLAEQADGIDWELEEIRKALPELKPYIDLTPVQQSLAEIQKSLTEMNKLLERVGNLSEKHSSKWIGWLPDFSLLVALKWIMLVLILGTAAMAGWYGAAAIFASMHRRVSSASSSSSINVPTAVNPATAGIRGTGCGSPPRHTSPPSPPCQGSAPA